MICLPRIQAEAAMDINTRIYTADTAVLSDSGLYRRLYEGAPQPRRDKIDRFRFPKDKRLSLGAWALLDYALREAGVSERTLEYNENGKPRLARRSDIHFNLSHSGTRVMCAVSDSEIGCDVEQMTASVPDIAGSCFCPEECAAIERCRDEESRRAMFFRYWTLKESFCKAVGLGLALPLSSFCITIRGGDITVRQNADKRQFFFRSFPHDGEYQYAVCSAEKQLGSIQLITASIGDTPIT